MALTPQNIAAAVAARPENLRGGSSRLIDGKDAFKTALTSQFGASRSLMNGKLKDPLPGLGEDKNTFANMLSSQVGTQAAQKGALPPLMPHPASPLQRTGIAQSVKQQSPQPPQATAQPQARIPTSPQPSAQTQPQAGQQAKGHEVRVDIAQQAKAQEVKTVINQNARHPDELGHLPGPGSKGLPHGGFTKEEEDLLLAAAGAESKFLAAKRQASRSSATAAKEGERIGTLSAMYESRGSIDAIGYDGRGGTSYGKYQIASGVGTMDRFLNYLDTKAPDLATRLDAAGPANSGGTRGGMTAEWKRIASEDPKRFESLQHEFIRDTHYTPALKSVTMSTGQDMSTRSVAVREVLWSTAVQHGPNGAAEIFSQALDKLEEKKQQTNDKALIEEVYAQRMAQFAGRGKLRVAVSTRLADEKQTALSMLGGQALS